MFQRRSRLRHRPSASSRRRVFFVGILIVVLASAGVASLAATHTWPFKKSPPPITAGTTTKGEVGTTQSPSNSPGPQSQDGTWSSDNKSPDLEGNDNTSQTPDVPDCNFVSNHKPSLGAHDTLQSSCVTTPGVTVRLSFTSNGVTKSLPIKTADAGGGAYWEWKLTDLGLNSGSWAIQATASMGAQATTSSDSINLEVQP